MTIYFSTNIPEFRSILQLNRASSRIADISHRLDSGLRINSAKDDPDGLIIRDRLRADMKGLYAAKENIVRADNMLSVADNGLASLSKFLLGNQDDGVTGLKALVNSTVSSTAESDALKAKIAETLNMMNGVSRGTTYNGKQILGGDLAYRTNFSDDGAKLSNLNITKASGGNQAVNVAVTAAATKASADIDMTSSGLAITEGDSITVRHNGAEYTYTFAEDIVAGSSEASVEEALTNLLKGTGLSVSTDTNKVEVTADEFGSSNTLFISINGISDTPSAFTGADTTKAAGVDAAVTVNGNQARVNGTHFSYSDPNGTLTLDGNVANVASRTSNFTVVGGGATFQLGKNVAADQQLQFGLSTTNTSTLGGSTGRLNDLLNLDYTSTADVKKASAIIDESIDNINAKRGQIGFMQGNILSPMKTYIEDDLASVVEAEGAISNVDVGLESSRLAREQLLASNALNSALFNRQYAQFLISSLW